MYMQQYLCSCVFQSHTIGLVLSIYLRVYDTCILKLSELMSIDLFIQSQWIKRWRTQQSGQGKSRQNPKDARSTSWF